MTNLKELVIEVDSARRTVEALKIEAKSTMEILVIGMMRLPKK